MNYDGHPYARTLRFFEAYYPYDTEKVNYAELMLSMDSASTIDELFSIRNRILDKYFEMAIILVKMPEEACKPLTVGSFEYFGRSGRTLDAIKDNKKKDVVGYYNSNIVRLYKESKNTTLMFCGECIVNMSQESDNYDEQIRKIVQYAKEVYNIDAEELSKELLSRKMSLRKKRLDFDNYNEGMNGYLSAKQKVQEDFDYIMKYKWRLTNSERDRYGIFLPRENIKTLIKPENATKEKSEESWVLPIISGLIGAGIFIAIIASGGGPLLLLFGVFAYLFIMKHGR